MKLFYSLVLTAIMAVNGIACADEAHAESNPEQQKVHHLVIIWLKQHGDEQARRKYIEVSKHLAEIPGVLAYDIGTPVPLQRERTDSAADDSYDLAISSTLESRQALDNYVKHPKHQKIIQDILKPMVDKYKVYDFIDPAPGQK